MRRLILIVVMATWGGSALAADMLVFKRESRYRGAALRVVSLAEGKDGRLTITAANGDYYSAAAADVDWEASRTMTEALHKKEAEMAEVAAEHEAQERAARLADTSDQEPLSVLDASRRYGVDRPGMTITDAADVHDIGQVAARPATSTAADSTEAKGLAENPGVQRAQSKWAAATANRDSIAKILEALHADRNPDPLSAANRGSQIERREKELQTAEQKVVEAKAALEAAQVAAAKKAKP